jgi:hypothetical protein
MNLLGWQQLAADRISYAGEQDLTKGGALLLIHYSYQPA